MIVGPHPTPQSWAIAGGLFLCRWALTKFFTEEEMK